MPWQVMWLAVCSALDVRLGRAALLLLLARPVHAGSDDVAVTVKGDGRTILQHGASQDGPWGVVCFAPCVSRASRVGWYRLIGARRTVATRVPSDALEVTFGADAEDDYVGLVVAGAGMVTLLGGGSVALVGAFDTTNTAMAVLITGTVLAGVGFVALLAGLIYHYEIRPSRLLPQEAAPPWHAEPERCASRPAFQLTIPF
jgi:hypothetical protein